MPGLLRSLSLSRFLYSTLIFILLAPGPVFASVSGDAGYLRFQSAISFDDDFEDGNIEDKYVLVSNDKSLFREEERLFITSTATEEVSFENNAVLSRPFFLHESFHLQIEVGFSESSFGFGYAALGIGVPGSQAPSFAAIGLMGEYFANETAPVFSQVFSSLQAEGGADFEGSAPFEVEAGSLYTVTLDYDADTQTLVASCPAANYSRLIVLSTYSNGFAITLMGGAGWWTTEAPASTAITSIAQFDNLESSLVFEGYFGFLPPISLDGVEYGDALSQDTLGGSTTYLIGRHGLPFRMVLPDTWVQLDGVSDLNAYLVAQGTSRATIFSTLTPSEMAAAVSGDGSLDAYVSAVYRAQGYGHDYVFALSDDQVSIPEVPDFFSQVSDTSKYIEYAIAPSFSVQDIELLSDHNNSRFHENSPSWMNWAQSPPPASFVYPRYRSKYFEAYLVPLTDPAIKGLPQSPAGYFYFEFLVPSATVVLLDDLTGYRYSLKFTYSTTVTPAVYRVPYFPQKASDYTDITVLLEIPDDSAEAVDGIKSVAEGFTVVVPKNRKKDLPYVLNTLDATTKRVMDFRRSAPVRPGAEFPKPIDVIPVKDEIESVKDNPAAIEQGVLATVQYPDSTEDPSDVTNYTLPMQPDIDGVSEESGEIAAIPSLRAMANDRTVATLSLITDDQCNDPNDGYVCYELWVWTRVALTALSSTEVIAGWLNGNGIGVEVWIQNSSGPDTRVCSGYSGRRLNPAGSYMDGLYRCLFRSSRTSIPTYVRLLTISSYAYVYADGVGAYSLTSDLKYYSPSNNYDFLRYDAGYWSSTYRNAFKIQALSHNVIQRSDAAVDGVDFDRAYIMFPVSSYLSWLYPSSRLDPILPNPKIGIIWEDRYRSHVPGHEAGHWVEYNLRGDDWHNTLPKTHFFCDAENEFVAWFEGFADFLEEAAFSATYGPRSSQNGNGVPLSSGWTLERLFYTTWDAHPCYPGHVVNASGHDDMEGPVASALWDLWDSPGYTCDTGAVCKGTAGHNDQSTYSLKTILTRVKNTTPSTFYQFTSGFPLCSQQGAFRETLERNSVGEYGPCKTENNYGGGGCSHGSDGTGTALGLVSLLYCCRLLAAMKRKSRN